MSCFRFSLLNLYKSFVIAAFLLAGATALGGTQPRQRISGNINEYDRFSLLGNVRPSLVNAQDQGAVPGATTLPRMTIHFSMTASQNADALQLMRLQQDRQSSQYHKWLTPEEYGDRFGLNTKDLQKVMAWLESVGFTDIEQARSRNSISFSGTAAQAQIAFNTSIHQYMQNGERHIANSNAPQLPRALNGMVTSVRGLHDFHPKPHLHGVPHFTSSITGNHFLAPDDFATIYDIKALYGQGIDGTGRSIVIPGQTDIALSDIEAFQKAAGLPVKDPQIILTGPDPGTSTTGDLGESDLDLEWSGAIAKGASIIFVNSTDVFTSVHYAIVNNVADVLAITYGLCEASAGSGEMLALNNDFAQAVLQGITVVSAAGDQGAADCDSSIASQGLAVDVPASSPYVTGMGGTTFNEGTAYYWSGSNNANSGSAISYIPETAWNDGTARTPSATGGGASIFNTKPAWQRGIGVPNDNARDVPDLSLSTSAAHDGYLICSGGSCVNGFRNTDSSLDVSGGTSAASPTFAAIVALLDQQTGSRQGLVNQGLYQLASTSSNAFHDITSGNNIVTCRGGTPNCSSTTANVTGTLGFSAGIGYDQVTGLGSVDAYNMINQWNGSFALSISPTSLTVSRGGSGTATVTAKPSGNFQGNVTFTCSVASSLTNTSCSVPGTATGGSGTFTLTVTAGATAAAPWWKRIPQPPASGFFYLLAALLMAVSAYLVRQRKIPAFAGAFALLLVVGLSSCGNGSSSSSSTSSPTASTGPAPETGVVTVVGTSGIITNSTTISVTVQ